MDHPLDWFAENGWSSTYPNWFEENGWKILKNDYTTTEYSSTF